MSCEPIRTFVRTSAEPLVVPSTVIQLRPTEFHLIKDGSITNGPSFVLMLSTETQPVVVAQLTLKMLFDEMSAEARSIIEKEWFELSKGTMQ